MVRIIHDIVKITARNPAYAKIIVEKNQHAKIAVERPKHTKINIKEAHTKINILKGAVGTPGKEGDVYVPKEDGGYLIWEKTAYNNSPISINMGALSQSISNVEILAIVNS